MKNKLILIGAGPGAPDLITYRGIKALKKARVILYDALVDEDIFSFTNDSAIKICVGKRGGRPSFEQSEINRLIVFYAAIYGEVIRLKGGDPFIFGRGLEEVEFAKRNGLEIVVIPGISSATGLTALQQISLTQRGIADGVWVITATKQLRQFNTDIELAAQSNSTVVVLMGVKKIAQIVTTFKKFNKGDLPVMIIQNGSGIKEKILYTEIDELESQAIENEIQSPAIIVIGETLRTQIISPQQLLTHHQN